MCPFFLLPSWQHSAPSVNDRLEALAVDLLPARGFAWIPRRSWSIAPGLTADLDRLREEWEHLEPDRYLAGAARFRLRRYGRPR